ncbi:hypothetical protein WMY93_032973 [Mugilogobius chulae]|uniref:Uncharacterized protein n=1 Tax=Mugilogobius chulae TaxID=88201 RepID=A0AAW0MPY9_9GOBI
MCLIINCDVKSEPRETHRDQPKSWLSPAKRSTETSPSPGSVLLKSGPTETQRDRLRPGSVLMTDPQRPAQVWLSPAKVWTHRDPQRPAQTWFNPEKVRLRDRVSPALVLLESEPTETQRDQLKSWLSPAKVWTHRDPERPAQTWFNPEKVRLKSEQRLNCDVKSELTETGSGPVRYVLLKTGPTETQRGRLRPG